MSLCRTCFDICEKDYSSPIEGELRNILKFCIPEMDLDITENPVLCKSCQTTLISVNEFKKKCLSTQQKILIFTNQSIKPEVKPILVSVEPTPVLPKVIEKVAPFKLKLKNKYSDTSSADCNSSESQKVEVRKRRHSEIAVAPPMKKETIKLKRSNVSTSGDNDQEDFLSLLDNSDNVSNPRTEGLSQLGKTASPTIDTTKNKQNTSKGFECKLCKKSYKNKYYLQVHKVSSVEHRTNMAKALAKTTPVQTGGHLYKCDNCSFSTKYKIGLNKHYPNCPNRETTANSSEDSNDTKKADSNLICRICSYMAFNNSVLAVHMSKKHSTAWAIYKCDRCSYQTTTKSKLRDHTNKVHTKEVKKKSKKVTTIEGTGKPLKEKIFICGHSGCGKGFVTKQGWLLHQSRHTSPLKRECPVCKKQFESGRGMNIHMESHKKNKSSKKITKESLKKESRKHGQKSAQKKDKKEKLTTKVGYISTNNAIEESETTGQILIRMDKVFSSNSTPHGDNISGHENSQEMNKIKNTKDTYQQAEDSLSQSEKIDNENERPMFEVEFVGTISDNENDCQEASNNENQLLRDTVFLEDQIEEEEEDKENSSLSQETIIMD